MKNLILLMSVALLFANCSSGNFLLKGNEAYENLAYAKAITYYEKGLQGKTDPIAAARLADSYRLTGNHDLAEKWYATAVADPSVTPETSLRYAKELLANGKVDLAKKQAARLLEINSSNVQARRVVEACDIRIKLQEAREEFTVAPTAFNVIDAADYCPTYLGNSIVFTSDRGGNAKNKWTGRSYAALYHSSSGERLKGDINGKYNDGAACFSTDGRTMYFTRNNYKGAKRTKDKSDVVNLVIARARLINDAWVYEDFFLYNSPDFSTAHPALSADGNTLVFASDRPGGLGGMDIWKSKFEGGTWSVPENLGPRINSEGNEVFPAFGAGGLLIFASNGWPGLGGLDIFSAPLETGVSVQPTNVGAPLNSAKDDFGCITRDSMDSGYFSTNRNSVNSTEDIWAFKRKPRPLQMAGIVVDKYTQIPLPGVRVDLQEKATGQLRTAVTGDDGRFSFDLASNSDYSVSGAKNNIPTNTKEATTRGRKQGEQVFVQLEHNDPRFTLRGTAVSRKTGAPVEGVLVNLSNTAKKSDQTMLTMADGKFFFQLDQNSDFVVSGQKDGVFASIKYASTKGLDRSSDLYVQLSLNVDILEIGTEVPLEDIYFDLNKSDIRPDAAAILDQLTNFLSKNSTIEIELTSHTDSRNTNDYNMKLSQRRAESTLNYLVKKGIAVSRLKARGYGETKLVNRCADGVSCTEAEHQQNRRTTFKVLKL